MVKTLYHKVAIAKRFHWTSAPFLMIIGVLGGCGSHVFHIVEPGETLYSISWMYGHDYRTVAQWNNIKSPYILHQGQRLRVAPFANDSTEQHKKRYDRRNNAQHAKQDNKWPEKERSKNERIAKKVSVKKSVTASSGRSKAPKASADKPHKLNNQLLPNSNRYWSPAGEKPVWSWPVKGGRIIQPFVANTPGKMGIDVAGKEGQTIYSASNGMVVYSGRGLPLYGKLIIIKHNETFLSAYAHNKKLLVKEGDVIKVGQPIALMGKTGSNSTKLHFEIRREGKPVNPLRYLPAKRPN